MTISTILPALLPALLLGLVGLVMGSFIGLVSLRAPEGRGVVAGRSSCRDCGRTLSPWSMIPVVSFVIQRGRCAACGGAIPHRYPLLELMSCGIGVWAALAQAEGPAMILTAALGWQLLLISLIDGEHFWLPDGLTLPLMATGLLASLLPGEVAPWDALAAAVTGFAGLWLLAVVYRRLRGREGLGGGDPILLAAGGAWVGLAGLPSILLWAAVAGLSLAGARAMRAGRESLSDPLPFGPCLAIGVWLTHLFGPLGIAR